MLIIFKNKELTSPISNLLKSYQQTRKSWHSFRGIEDDKTFLNPEIITTFDYNNIYHTNRCFMSNSTVLRNSRSKIIINFC